MVRKPFRIADFAAEGGSERDFPIELPDGEKIYMRHVDDIPARRMVEIQGMQSEQANDALIAEVMSEEDLEKLDELDLTTGQYNALVNEYFAHCGALRDAGKRRASRR